MWATTSACNLETACSESGELFSVWSLGSTHCGMFLLSQLDMDRLFGFWEMHTNTHASPPLFCHETSIAACPVRVGRCCCWSVAPQRECTSHLCVHPGVTSGVPDTTMDPRSWLPTAQRAAPLRESCVSPIAGAVFLGFLCCESNGPSSE